AVGDSLDLLGEDVGLARRRLFAEGDVRFTISNPAPGRQYVLPEGAVVVTAPPVRAFYTTAPLSLSAAAPQGTVRVRAFERGAASPPARSPAWTRSTGRPRSTPSARPHWPPRTSSHSAAAPPRKPTRCTARACLVSRATSGPWRACAGRSWT